jgi:hypothetical protein
MPKNQGMGLYDSIGRLPFMVTGNMVACVECGKRLRFFEGHYHPTLGRKSLLCGSCFIEVEESVARWRDFVLSNSFNPETTNIAEELHKATQKKTRKSSSQVALNNLSYHSKDTLVQIGERTA